MRVPSADELAAIAVAYLAVTRDRRGEWSTPAEAPRWRLAGRMNDVDPQRARIAARATSRWKLAGRLDG